MFIAVDLKVVEGLAAAVGRAGGMSEDAVLAGLVRLWHRCWADGADLFGGDEISGMFAFDASNPNGSARALAALVAFGFLESKAKVWRVRGAARYLRLKESRRRGAAATNAARWGTHEDTENGRSKSDALERPASDAEHRSLTESPNTEHRVTEEKPSAGRKKRGRAEKPVDPRHAPMRTALIEAFRRKRGIEYPFDYGREDAEVRRLLKLGLEPTVLAAWERALDSSYPTISTLAKFRLEFPRFVGRGETTGTQPAKGAAWTHAGPDDGKGFAEGLES